MLYKSIDGVVVPLTAEEEFEIRSEWTANETKEITYKEILETKILRETALQILLEDLLTKNSNIPEVKLYLDKKSKNDK